jgi:16S rRNA (guanine966-N2)-methyltransferase
MRIISGSLGGRNFDAPAGHKTHPMSDKARGGLFNVLGDITGLTVLDAFAGSGALSFEAISRGARRATAIDIDGGANKSVVNGAQELNISNKIKAIRANASGWSDNNINETFDLVLCDPPYDMLQLSLLQKLSRHVGAKGLLVLSWPGKLTAPEFVGLEQIKTQNYGDIQLVFYRRIS